VRTQAWRHGADVLVRDFWQSGENVKQPGINAGAVVLAGDDRPADAGGYFTIVTVANEQPIQAVQGKRPGW